MAKRGSDRHSERSGGGIGTISVMDLQRELARRQRAAGSLMKKRDRLASKLEALDTQIAALGATAGLRRGATGGGLRRRPKNDSNLVEALQKLLDNKTMGVTDITEAVQRAGYQTTSPSFRTIVNQTLINSGKFKRVSRGQYTVK